MPQEEDPKVDQPEPDPWAPRGATYLQGGSLGSGAAGAAFVSEAASSSPPYDGQSLAMLLDPAELFGRGAQILGFQVEASSALRVGLVLVVLSVLLNLISLWLRYRYAKQVEAKHAAARADREAKERALQQAAKSSNSFIRGDG